MIYVQKFKDLMAQDFMATTVQVKTSSDDHNGKDLQQHMSFPLYPTK